MDSYAVIGHPITHSLSPRIHMQFAHQTDQSLSYDLIDVSSEKVMESIQQFRACGGKGLSVTTPFKALAYRLATKHSLSAKQAGAANTLCFNPSGEIYADSTDGLGLLRDITNNLSYSLHQKKILLLGAGDAVKCILPSLLSQQPKQLDIANRTPEKAIAMAKKFHAHGTVQAMALNQIPEKPYDLIINAASASLEKKRPLFSSATIDTNTWCYDLSYSKKPTKFLQWSKQQGALRCIDGFGMLVEQAAAQFYLWRGLSPDTQTLLQKKYQLYDSL